MLPRLVLLVITAFWVTMNVLLVRSEFGPRAHVGSAVPVEVVLQKILTAPDNSALEIQHRGKKIGYCRWAPNIGEEIATGKAATEEAPPEGMVKRLTGYTIDLDGNMDIAGFGNRPRFSLSLKFSTNHVWQELQLRLNLKPQIWDIYSSAASEKLTVRINDDEGVYERAFRFADLQNPQLLLREFGGPLAAGMLGGLGVSSGQTNAPQLSVGLQWEARNDWLKIGHSQVRVYCLQTRVLERYEVVVYVSKVGEILRVELPNGLVLANDGLNL